MHVVPSPPNTCYLIRKTFQNHKNFIAVSKWARGDESIYTKHTTRNLTAKTTLFRLNRNVFDLWSGSWSDLRSVVSSALVEWLVLVLPVTIQHPRLSPVVVVWSPLWLCSVVWWNSQRVLWEEDHCLGIGATTTATEVGEIAGKRGWLAALQGFGAVLSPAAPLALQGGATIFIDYDSFLLSSDSTVFWTLVSSGWLLLTESHTLTAY